VTDNQPPTDLPQSEDPATSDALTSVTTTEQLLNPSPEVDAVSDEIDPDEAGSDELGEDEAGSDDAGSDDEGDEPAGVADATDDTATSDALESVASTEQAVDSSADATADDSAGTAPAEDLFEGEQAAGDEVVVDDVTMRRALEAVLMVSDEPLPVLTLARAVGRPTGDVSAALTELSGEYTEQGRGFDLREVGGGWRYYTREDTAPYVERFVLDGQQARLTQAALETLAVVAYKQPVSRARVSAIRGVNVDGVMRTLISRGLVEEAGADTESQATLYRTTSYFLERMGMQSLDDLPELAPYLPEMEDMEDELAAQAASAVEAETAAAAAETEVPEAEVAPEADEAITSDVGAAEADPEVASAAAEAVDVAAADEDEDDEQDEADAVDSLDGEETGDADVAGSDDDEAAVAQYKSGNDG
jgi:segregation and condensation protein B